MSAPVAAGAEMEPSVWRGQSYANSSDALFVARLDIPNRDYNRLHMRAIDVSVYQSRLHLTGGDRHTIDGVL